MNSSERNAIAVDPFTLAEHRYSIVVVDANKSITQLTKRILAMKGHEVLAANDGETAIEIIRALKPDVVLTSIEVPKLDGFEIAREIRRLMPESPFIIAMTGYNREYISMRGGDTAFDLVLLKPLVITDLWDSLARLHECPRKRLTPKVALKS
jgi:CheY-like chemotaxis protein